MKNVVLRYGVISGVIAAALMAFTVIVLEPRCGSSVGYLIGYTGLVLSFLMVYFGIRSYRDTVAGGTISFGRAVGVGLLIAVITCVFYVAAWEIVYWNFMPDFMDKYAAQVIAHAQATGVSGAALQAKIAEMEKLKVQYKNPLFNIGMTFLEPLPVGIVITLISAALLKRTTPKEPMAVEAAA